MVRRSPFGILSQITMSRLPMVLIRSDSPRVYVSTNPWKVTSTFQTVSSTRDEYVALIGKLKASAPTKPKMKAEFAHQNLTMALEGRLEVVDKEIMVCFLRGVVDYFLQSPCHSAVFLPVASRTHLFFFSGYSVHAKRLSSAIFSSLKLKSGKREHGGRLTGLITFTMMSKVATYVFQFQALAWLSLNYSVTEREGWRIPISGEWYFRGRGCGFYEFTVRFCVRKREPSARTN